jgi:diguanylate cyclase (GGDEF)-like protein
MPGRILLVDDSQLVRVVLAQHLVAAGFQVDEAESGAIALERLSHGNYDVMITDLRMPGLSGVEVLAAVKEVAGGVAVIVLTGAHSDDMGAANQALRLGAHDYLIKPPQSADEVVLTAARAMEKKQLRETNRQLEQRLEALALTDALTGVPNRRAFDQALEEEVARARRFGEPLGVIALDIDQLKRVNDRCGREGGDEVLRGFTQTVRGVLRKGDSLYRCGGEEFAVLLPFAEYEGVLAVGERIVAAVRRSPVKAGTLTVPITTSAGAACLEQGYDGRELISRAEAALHQAKSSGRNRVCLQSGSTSLAPVAGDNTS